MTFDPVELCAVLDDEEVEFVVLGGFAAIIHGSPLPTEDIDVIPSREGDNLDRLARALKRLGARIRTGAEPIETTIDSAFIRNMPHMLNLATRFGELDLVFTPAGSLKGYKVAANRPKDQRLLPYLESLREQLGETNR